jgi:hypothetical protein
MCSGMASAPDRVSQRARREASTGESNAAYEAPPPFMSEWPALNLKLVFLNAVLECVNAVAWTSGALQVSRYKGLGAEGLTELYGCTLPIKVNRMVNPFA